ncbi:hypothetical protein AMATHDRAFT_47718 [Amanita thiersii Skay4041]|uniref:Uncharacterized protein n=1 Tax=Amanita thiersii Skay4041 TaxID=703135 RepID=A0A2A9NSM2_9AGAR|nr:hypothetical protein AMATHDRAFT_47718 [Amanita thiersii Skay4041]
MVHHAFQIHATNENWFIVKCLIEPVSGWALEEMPGQLKKQDAATAYKFYCTVNQSFIAPTIHGKMFKNWVHPFLQDTKSFTITSLKDGSTLCIHFTSNECNFKDLS